LIDFLLLFTGWDCSCYWERWKIGSWTFRSYLWTGILIYSIYVLALKTESKKWFLKDLCNIISACGVKLRWIWGHFGVIWCRWSWSTKASIQTISQQQVILLEQV